jgi:hypothetical protein
MNEDDVLSENLDLLEGIENVRPAGLEKLPESLLFALERARLEALEVRRRTAQGKVSWMLRIAAVVFCAGLGWFWVRDGSLEEMLQLTSRPGAVSPSTNGDLDYSQLLKEIPFPEELEGTGNGGYSALLKEMESAMAGKSGPQAARQDPSLKRPSVAQPAQGSQDAVSVAQVSVIFPIGAMVGTRPTVEWSSRDKPGQMYDVWILSASGDYRSAPGLFKAEKVVSPVEFSAFKRGRPEQGDALEPGMEYRLLVCLAGKGRLAGVPLPFRVAPKSSPQQ